MNFRISLLVPLAVNLAFAASPHDFSPPIQKPGPEFGTELKAEALKIGSTMDVAVAGDHVFAIGQGDLRVLSNARDGKPALVRQLGGLGNTRQIAVSRGHASITDHKLFIADPFLGDVAAFDLSEAANPKLIAQLHLSGHPGRVKVHRGKSLIPAGREGLLLW